MYEVFYKGTMIAQFKDYYDAKEYYWNKLTNGYVAQEFYIAHTIS